ncbi:hypothetical protein DMH08_02820 [Actinomadura sp. WAC 06369]|nr:hypothetical protein DMH08_02820 [Actinomadura sp. WAC 06369]
MGLQHVALSRRAWDEVMTALGSGHPEAVQEAYTLLLALAPAVWEPSRRPVFDGVGGSGDGDAPGHVPGPPASPSPEGDDR